MINVKAMLKATSVMALIVMLSGCIIAPPHHDRYYRGGGYHDGYRGGYYDGYRAGYHNGDGPRRGW